jgi:signal transduction histidine kinase/DNA-binding response OmpR family regulator
MSTRMSDSTARIASGSSKSPEVDPGPERLHGRDIADKHLLSSARMRLRLMLLALLLVGPLTGLLLLLVGSVFSKLTPALQEDLRWKAQQGVIELSQTADLGVLAGNVEVLKKATDRAARERDFLYVGFHDARDAVIYERGSLERLPAIEHTAESLSENEHAFASWAPVNVEGLRVGSVTLAVSKQRLDSGAQLYRSFVIVGLLGAFVALVLAAWFVRRYIAPLLRLTERTLVELARTADEALASARAKSQFLANMSHEIRTPMNGVFGMLHLVEQTELTPLQRRYLSVMAGSAKSLLTVVNDVLDFSKLEANRYELAPVACRVRELIEQTVSLFQPKAEEKGLMLRAHVDPSVPELILVDPDRLRQVLSNLLSNAVKFTSRGEVDVWAGTVADEPRGSATPSRWLEVRVCDTGIGISESSRGQLFAAFSQVDASSSRSHEGTGLGLAISRKLLDLMGGRIEHVQPDGEGSVFRFVLPITSGSKAPAPLQAAPPARPLRFRSDRPVLLVDDNEINLLVAVEVLESMNLKVEVASGGREAIEATLSGDYALVLMDCQMPEVDGYQAASEIRRLRPEPHLPIIAFTAHALAEERAKVAACGMDDIVTKPLDPALLSRVLARWLDAISGAEHGDGSAVARVPAAQRLPRGAEQASAPSPAAELPAIDTARRRPRRAVQLFVDTVPEQLALLARNAASGQRAEVKALAHKLKGSAGSLGALEMARSCDRLQLEALALSPAQLSEQVEQISHAYEVARELLRAELERLTVTQ